ncbi:Uncharacterized conserved protein YjiS, DUF1127 family [Mesorhizobium albiziae]|uniref:Uncharacterized conserved protein YjiS, DUF1127 family n=1 Tax=Neomesorhizobium albiziae TaxID=335020 RepID=A0A1I4EKI3_9HYPH|nr:DUF1127 domain-containing protein [Mesorhizobium albiziae]GLS30917.1 hypothetical protein GCM10007937_26260 [Mesorhizobium albiziae]SFL05580.1 Uncharacterized conserved protein YjiS, DUF1127 family [Mesorhizobium albiziae]
MTNIEQSKPFPLGRHGGPLPVPVRSVFQRFRVLAKEISRRQAIGALREFEDHELRDIGLARSQIEAAVRGFFTLSETGRMS